MQTIPLINLSLAFIPVLIALFILVKWSLEPSNAVYALSRMLVQLLMIGYFLAFIFNSNSALLVLVLLILMLFASSWIALRTVQEQRVSLLRYAFLAILCGGGFTLFIMSQVVLNLKPWFDAQSIIPLAGMIFANGMNCVSLAAERMTRELKQGTHFLQARKIAVRTALIPVTNSLFAVGLVSLPGMMTGQILSGVSPLIAVRYQIMVMCMFFASSVICSALFLIFSRTLFEKPKQRFSELSRH